MSSLVTRWAGQDKDLGIDERDVCVRARAPCKAGCSRLQAPAKEM